MLPEPVITEHDGILVVRDDLLEGGSKRRFLRTLVESQTASEWVYASPCNGYGQISLAYVCRDLGRTATIFVPKRGEMHEYTKEAVRAGAEIIEVPMGFYSNCAAKARRYAEIYDAAVAPFGFDDKLVIDEIALIASKLPVEPAEVWSILSSGTLSRGLQKAWPNAVFLGVSVGHKPKPEQMGNATVYGAPEKFSATAKILPPFPSAPTYDAKAWRFIKQYAKPGALFWNVGK